MLSPIFLQGRRQRAKGLSSSNLTLWSVGRWCCVLILCAFYSTLSKTNDKRDKYPLLKLWQKSLKSLIPSPHFPFKKKKVFFSPWLGSIFGRNKPCVRSYGGLHTHWLKIVGTKLGSPEGTCVLFCVLQTTVSSQNNTLPTVPNGIWQRKQNTRDVAGSVTYVGSKWHYRWYTE